ncbi:MAG: BNR-4 repeat-containing protein, partial [Phycisphaerae bacterium]
MLAQPTYGHPALRVSIGYLLAIGLFTFCATAQDVRGQSTTPASPSEDPLKSIGTDDGYRGIWYSNQETGDEYVYKYSGGLGTYCAKHSPFAIYSAKANKTFFCYGGTVKGKQELLEMVSFYDHVTGTVPRPTILMNKGTDDAHDNPVISMDDKGFIFVFCSSHGTARPSYIFKSDRPYSTDAFTAVYKGNFSYTQPWYWPGEGFLFIHTLYRKGGRASHWSTSRDGITWTEPHLLAFYDEGHYQVSRPGKGVIGLGFNYHPK